MSYGAATDGSWQEWAFCKLKYKIATNDQPYFNILKYRVCSQKYNSQSVLELSSLYSATDNLNMRLKYFQIHFFHLSISPRR